MTSGTVTGYGTLIVTDDFNMNNSTLNWYGDIFVIGADGVPGDNFADIKIDSSTLNVTGNLIVLGNGEGAGSTQFQVKDSGTVNVDGSLFFGTDWNVDGGTESQFEIVRSGTVNVDGIMTMVGPDVAIILKYNASSSKALNITGALQIAVPAPLTGDTDLQMDFRGASLEIHRDVAAMRRGVGAMNNLGLEHGVPNVSQLIDYGVEVLAYRKLTGPPDITGSAIPTSVLGMRDYFDDLAVNNPGPIADAAEDISAQLDDALDELAASPPDTEAAAETLSDAESDVQEMIDDGLIDAQTGQELITQIAAIRAGF